MTDNEFPPEFGPGWLEAQTVARARAGDREAALALLETAGLSLMARSLEPAVADYMAEVLLAAHECLKDDAARPGEVLTKAFRLGRRRGRPDESRTLERDSDIAVWVHLAVERGAKLSGAKRRASTLFGVANVDRVLRANSPVSIPADALERWESYFNEHRKPLPPRR